MRLRVAWGGEAPGRWAGHVSLSEGDLTRLEFLGRERDTPGSIWLDQGEVHFSQPSPRSFDGFDITARAPPSALLRVEFRRAGDPSPVIVETTLADLMTHPLRSSLDEQGNQLLVHRAQDDALRLQVARDHLIFSPGEPFAFTLLPAIAALEPGASFDLALELIEGREGTSVWSNTERVTLSARGSAEIPLEIPLPDREGVYTVQLIARTPPGNRARFWEGIKGSEPLASRRFQVVVLGNEPRASRALPDWQTVLEIDPANPHWHTRVPEWVRLDPWSGGGKGLTGSAPVATTEWQGKRLAKLTSNGDTPPSWHAYPLHGAKPGVPHVVEIDLPKGVEQQLVLRIFEPDATGKLVPSGPGHGAASRARHLPLSSSTDDETMAKFRTLFWPKTSAPVLVVQNIDSSAVLYGAIRLQVASDGPLPSPLSDATKERAVVAYFSWEGLVDRMGASRLDAHDRLATDDRLTFFQTAKRLADYLEMSGYNGAVVNVFADGGAACRCAPYPVTPRLHSCRLTSGMDDLPRADPLELLLRIFDRRGLRLTPTLRFTSSLPGVEESLREDRRPGEESPLWTDRAGRPRRSVAPDRAAGPPHYKISHEKVRQEVRALIDSVVDRYGSHRAFAGLGMELTAESYLPLPPSTYGLSRTRLVQLAKETRTTKGQLARWLHNPRLALQDPAVRRHWNAQRAVPLTEFFRAVATDLRKKRPDASLLLLTDELLASREYDAAIQPRLDRRLRPEEIYLERGIAVKDLRRSPGILLPNVHHSVVATPLADAAIAMELNKSTSPSYGSKEVDSASSLLIQTPQWLPLPEVEPVAAESIPRFSRVSFSPVGVSRNGPLLEAIRDHKGGPLVMGGILGPSDRSDSDRQILELLRRLPASDDPQNDNPQSIDTLSQQPVVTHAYRSDGKTFCIALNPSPWQVEASLTIDVAERVEGQLFRGTSDSPPSARMIYAPGQHAWLVSLPPYAIQLLEFSSEKVRLAGLRIQLSPEVAQQLATRCDELERRDLKPDKLPIYDELENPSFEITGPEGLPAGWVSMAGRAEATTPSYQGEKSLRLLATGEAVSIASQPFPVPPTGQIALTVYVRASDLGDDAELRLILEEVGSNRQPRFISLSAARLQGDRKVREWNGYQFGIEDLPLDSTAQMRVRFELVGHGEVRIDQVELHELVFPLDLYPTESQQQVLALVQHMQQARTALDERRFSDCETMLDSYWSRFLLAYLPEIEEEPVAPPSKADSPPAAKTPKLTDRVRDLFRF